MTLRVALLALLMAGCTSAVCRDDPCACGDPYWEWFYSERHCPVVEEEEERGLPADS